jgi:hypothetical protein
MIDKEEIFQVIKVKGYVIPSDLTRQFRLDTFMIGALLSDLVREKKLQISRVKIGSSPVYYILEQREKLQDLYSYLSEKDKQTYQLLKKELVLCDAEQTPLVRVSLRNIKDYAKPIEVTVAGQTQLFWKWYLTTDTEVHATIATLFNRKFPQHPQKTPEEKKIVLQAPSIEKQPVLLQEKQREPLRKQKLQKKQPSEKRIVQEPVPDAVQHHLSFEEHVVSRPPVFESNDPFAHVVQDYFQTKQIQLVHLKTIKRGELECLVKVPSSLGAITYYCKAKKKKSCTEGDLATAFVAAQLRKLPALFLTTGQIPKKFTLQVVQDYPNLKIIQLS